MAEFQLALAPADDAARCQQDLPPELLPRILARLPTNEVPCTARLICKAAKAALSSPEHTTIRLSQPSPHGEFARRWGVPGAMRPLTLVRRRRLLALTAASGCLHNLTWLAEHVGCLPDASVLEAAAAAGRLEACRWLLQQQLGGEYTQQEEGLGAAMVAAAGAGQRSTLEALLADPGAHNLPKLRDGEDFRTNLAICAARGGHVGLMDGLLERFTPPSDAGWEYELLAAAAAGCDLAALQRLLLARQPHPAQLEQLEQQERPGRLSCLVGCAASSCTRDWRAKAEWLEACLVVPLLNKTACADAAACPTDALERLTWLRAHGCPWDYHAVTSAAGAGNLEALSYLLAEGCGVKAEAIRAAATGGHLAALEVLHSHGLMPSCAHWAYNAAAAAAAYRGQLPVVRWLLEKQLVTHHPPEFNFEEPHLLGCAAQSGSMELLSWLRARGYPWGNHDFPAAVRGGSEEAQEWAVEQGCYAQFYRFGDQEMYSTVASRGDWSTLACLRRLGVPWSPQTNDDWWSTSGSFLCAVMKGCSVEGLRRLLELGCPADLQRAAEVSVMDGHQNGEAVRAWLKEEEQRQREMGAAQQ